MCGLISCLDVAFFQVHAKSPTPQPSPPAPPPGLSRRFGALWGVPGPAEQRNPVRKCGDPPHRPLESCAFFSPRRPAFFQVHKLQKPVSRQVDGSFATETSTPSARTCPLAIPSGTARYRPTGGCAAAATATATASSPTKSLFTRPISAFRTAPTPCPSYIGPASTHPRAAPPWAAPG